MELLYSVEAARASERAIVSPDFAPVSHVRRPSNYTQRSCSCMIHTLSRTLPPQRRPGFPRLFPSVTSRACSFGTGPFCLFNSPRESSAEKKDGRKAQRKRKLCVISLPSGRAGGEARLPISIKCARETHVCTKLASLSINIHRGSGGARGENKFDCCVCGYRWLDYGCAQVYVLQLSPQRHCCSFFTLPLLTKFNYRVDAFK